MRPWKANRDAGRGDQATEREASAYVRIVLELVRDASCVPSRGDAVFTRVSPRLVDSLEPQ